MPATKPTLKHSTVERVKVSTVDGLWRAQEVMAFLRISRSSLYRMINEGQLPSYRIGATGDLRFRPNDVMNLVIPQPGTGKLTM